MLRVSGLGLGGGSEVGSRVGRGLKKCRKLRVVGFRAMVAGPGRVEA